MAIITGEDWYRGLQGLAATARGIAGYELQKRKDEEARKDVELKRRVLADEIKWQVQRRERELVEQQQADEDRARQAQERATAEGRAQLESGVWSERYGREAGAAETEQFRRGMDRLLEQDPIAPQELRGGVARGGPVLGPAFGMGEAVARRGEAVGQGMAPDVAWHQSVKEQLLGIRDRGLRTELFEEIQNERETELVIGNLSKERRRMRDYMRKGTMPEAEGEAYLELLRGIEESGVGVDAMEAKHDEVKAEIDAVVGASRRQKNSIRSWEREAAAFEDYRTGISEREKEDGITAPRGREEAFDERIDSLDDRWSEMSKEERSQAWSDLKKDYRAYKGETQGQPPAAAPKSFRQTEMERMILLASEMDPRIPGGFAGRLRRAGLNEEQAAAVVAATDAGADLEGVASAALGGAVPDKVGWFASRDPRDVGGRTDIPTNMELEGMSERQRTERLDGLGSDEIRALGERVGLAPAEELGALSEEDLTALLAEKGPSYHYLIAKLVELVPLED